MVELDFSKHVSYFNANTRGVSGLCLSFVTEEEVDVFVDTSNVTMDDTISINIVVDRLVEIDTIEISNLLKCEGTLLYDSVDECLTADTFKHFCLVSMISPNCAKLSAFGFQ